MTTRAAVCADITVGRNVPSDAAAATLPERRLRLEPAPTSLPAPAVPAGPAASAFGTRTSSNALPGAGRGVQGSLALSFPLPSGAPEAPSVPAAARVLRRSPGAAPTRQGHSGHLRLVAPLSADDEYETTGRAELPDPRVWAGQLVQGLLEVIAGDRPVAQLSRWIGHEVYLELQRRVRSSARSCPPHLRQARRGSVRSLHLCEPSDGVVEVAAMVAGAGRAAAVALRLEGRDGRWLCTALELG